MDDDEPLPGILSQQRDEKKRIQKRRDYHLFRGGQPCTLNGFTLIELMIALVMICILVALAVPSYKSYTRRAHFTEIIQAASPFKLSVDECFEETNDLNDCNNNQFGIPPAIQSGEGSGMVNSISVVKGVITITPHNQYGITSNDTYILTPSIEHDSLVWKASGGAVTHGYAS